MLDAQRTGAQHAPLPESTPRFAASPGAAAGAAAAMAARTRQTQAVQQHMGPAPMTPYGHLSAGAGGEPWPGGGAYSAASAGQGFQPGRLGAGAALGAGGVALAQQLGGAAWGAAPALQSTHVTWPAVQGHAAASAAQPSCFPLLQALLCALYIRGKGRTVRGMPSTQHHCALCADMLACGCQ